MLKGAQEGSRGGSQEPDHRGPNINTIRNLLRSYFYAALIIVKAMITMKIRYSGLYLAGQVAQERLSNPTTMNVEEKSIGIKQF